MTERSLEDEEQISQGLAAKRLKQTSQVWVFRFASITAFAKFQHRQLTFSINEMPFSEQISARQTEIFETARLVLRLLLGISLEIKSRYADTACNLFHFSLHFNGSLFCCLINCGSNQIFKHFYRF